MASSNDLAGYSKTLQEELKLAPMACFTYERDWTDLADFIEKKIVAHGFIGASREKILDVGLCCEEVLNLYKNYMQIFQKGGNKIVGTRIELSLIETLGKMVSTIFEHLSEERADEFGSSNVTMTMKIFMSPGCRAIHEENLKKKNVETTYTNVATMRHQYNIDYKNVQADGPFHKNTADTAKMLELYAARHRCLIAKIVNYYKRNRLVQYSYLEDVNVQNLSRFFYFYKLVEEDQTVLAKNKKWFLNFINVVLESYEKYPRYSGSTFMSHMAKYDPRIFQLHKVEQVCNTLSLAIYGSDKNNKNNFVKNTYEEYLVKRVLQGRNDPSNDGRDRRSLWLLLHRLEASLKICLSVEELKGPIENPIRSASSLCRMLAASSLTDYGFADRRLYSIPSRLLAGILEAQNKRNGDEYSLQQVKEESNKLTEQQIMLLSFYLSIDSASCKVQKLKKPPKKHSCLDDVEEAFWCYLDKDVWRLKQYITSWLGRNAEVSLQVARENAPTCFKLALSHIDSQQKVALTQPGEVTFFPIMHCKWCGMVNSELRVCEVCTEYSDYPDQCRFCSAKCEEEAMEVLHKEEHARNLVNRLGL